MPWVATIGLITLLATILVLVIALGFRTSWTYGLRASPRPTPQTAVVDTLFGESNDVHQTHAEGAEATARSQQSHACPSEPALTAVERAPPQPPTDVSPATPNRGEPPEGVDSKPPPQFICDDFACYNIHATNLTAIEDD